MEAVEVELPPLLSSADPDRRRLGVICDVVDAVGDSVPSAVAEGPFFGVDRIRVIRLG